MTLNEQQEKAVRTTRGRLLVLAGAGSGKTRVIVHRIAHLIDKERVDPGAILGLTFTNKAAREMRMRLASLVAPSFARKVTLSTFHSFCMQVLRKEIERLGYTRDFSLYDERDLERLIQQIAREMLGCEGELPSLAPTRAALAEVGNRGLTEETKSRCDPFSQSLYTQLQSTLRAYNAVTFDNLIQLCLRLFEEHPAILDQYQEQYRYLMIDEYQDTNPVQFQLAELLAKKYQNLCVVGDDDQSIYGWRGAEVNHILRFCADCTVKLEQNYRSTPSILSAANAVIAQNRNRHEKKLWSTKPHAEPIEIFHAPTDAEEAQAVVQRILRLREEGVRLRDIAILYRSNVLSRTLEVALAQVSHRNEGQWVRGIPYEIFGGLAFSERGEIKDTLAYLRALANPLDQEALLRILNVPRRGISDTLLDTLTQLSRTRNIPLWTLLTEVASGKKSFAAHPRGVSGIRSFVELFEKAKRRFEHSCLSETLLWFLEEVDYKRAIVEEVKSEKMRSFKWENVQECVGALAHYEEEEKERASLQGFVANTALAKSSFAAEAKRSNEDRVQLMTLHSAKGLEFRACFIIGLEDHILPHEKSMQETSLEEERRLFYVGITRAKERLTLSMARSRMRMGKSFPTNPSRFLFEIPKELLNITSHKLL